MVQVSEKIELEILIKELKSEIRKDRLIRVGISALSISSMMVSAFVCVNTRNILEIIISLVMGIMVSIDFFKYLRFSIDNTGECKSILREAKKLKNNMSMMGE